MPGFGAAAAPTPRRRVACARASPMRTSRASKTWVDARADDDARAGQPCRPERRPPRRGIRCGLSRPLLERGSRHPVARGLESTAQDVDFGVEVPRASRAPPPSVVRVRRVRGPRPRRGRRGRLRARGHLLRRRRRGASAARASASAARSSSAAAARRSAATARASAACALACRSTARASARRSARR